MDPKVTAELLRDAMNGDRAGVAEAADALIGWLEKDGFNPFEADTGWLGGLTRHELKCYLRDLRAVAEMV